jgi:hypothetical protein
VEAGYTTEHVPEATTALDGGAEETVYDSGYSNGATAAAQPSNPFTRQQYQQVTI